MVKLENFKQKIYCLGVKDDLTSRTQEKLSPEAVNEIAKNMIRTRNLIRDIKPENVVVELCDERYDSWYYDIISHPNYDNTISDIHYLLDKENITDLLKYQNFNVSEGNAEYLIGIDVCSYRLPCKTLMGDRDFNITRKRY